MSEFKQHYIELDDRKINILWDYYANTFPYNKLYFTNMVRREIIKKTCKYFNLNDKVILDFGCGPAFLIGHMVKLNIRLKKYIGLDFSEKSIT